MATKIYVSQIDTANSTGGQADVGSVILVGSNGAYWSNNVVLDILGIPLSELTGYTGSVGPSGYRGSEGYQGSAGFLGSVGPDGPIGAAGFQGSLGDTGYLGSVGYTGSVGNLGPSGYRGSEGYQGSVGSIGPVGYLGSVGYRGSSGSTGYQGSTGATGTLAFIDLTDVPQSYSGKANYFLRVNAAATGIVFDSNVYITNTVSTAINFAGNTIISPVIKNYSEAINDIGSANTVITGPVTQVTVDPIDGNIITILLDKAIVPIFLGTTGVASGKSFSFTLILKQDSYGGRTVDWSLNDAIYWPAGEGIYAPDGPTLSTTPNYTDFVTFMTTDGGLSWYGLMSAKGFPTV
jgi:hypothetical protein